MTQSSARLYVSNLYKKDKNDFVSIITFSSIRKRDVHRRDFRAIHPVAVYDFE